MTDHSKQTTKSYSFNLSKLKEEVYEELTQDILPFWSEKMKDSEHADILDK
jgi:mannose/cellobiose epimerase-like protein (N-acyl-D-glucosamine 2-epimerase family)